MTYDKRRHTVGDVVQAPEAFDAVARMLWRERLGDRELRYIIEGSNTLLSPEQADRWVKESARLGYTEVRFLIAEDDGRTVVIELAAISPLDATEDE